MSKKAAAQSARPQATRKWRTAGHHILLDRACLTVELPNPRTGGVGRHDANPHGNWICSDAPPNFHVNASLDRNEAYLWIGIDPEPLNAEAARTCFAVITGDSLRELAQDVLRCYPDARTGGAR